MSYTHVAGVDLSLTCAGVSVVAPDGSARVELVRSSGKLKDPYLKRIARIAAIADAVTGLVPAGALAVIEGPSYGSIGSSTWDRAGLWHRVAFALVEAGVEIAVAPPSVVKKWATGSGSADKAAVASAITRLRPDIMIETSDAADSLALGFIGAHYLGWEQYSKARTECLEKIEWPVDALAAVA